VNSRKSKLCSVFCEKGQPGTSQRDVSEGELLFDTLVLDYILLVLERNYLEVYPYERCNDREMPPEFRLGDRFDVRVELIVGETEPRSLLKEADLISLMEKYEIGTDATPRMRNT
jgi:hypothetical protein